MSGPLEAMKARVARQIKRWNQGQIQLVRNNEGGSEADPIPTASSPTTMNLDAIVRGGGQYMDGTEVVTYDMVLIVSPIVYVPAFDEYDTITPLMNDIIFVQGEQKIIRRIERVPFDNPAKFRIFVSGG